MNLYTFLDCHFGTDGEIQNNHAYFNRLLEDATEEVKIYFWNQNPPGDECEAAKVWYLCILKSSKMNHPLSYEKIDKSHFRHAMEPKFESLVQQQKNPLSGY